MLNAYIVSSLFIWGMLVYFGLSGGRFFDYESSQGHRPTGPGQHFHK